LKKITKSLFFSLVWTIVHRWQWVACITFSRETKKKCSTNMLLMIFFIQ